MAVDPWTTDSGLPKDLAATVVDARFEESEEYERIQAIFEFEAEGHEPFSGFYSVGSTAKGWEVTGRGTGVEHADGKRFHKNSAIGELVTALADSAPAAWLQSSDPKQAKTFIGLKCHWERVERVFKIDGETMVTERLLPTKVLSVPRTQKTQKAGTNGDVAPEIKTAINALVEASETEDDFLNQAFTIDGVLGNDAAETYVAEAWEQVNA